MSVERPSKEEIFNTAAELVDAAERQAYLHEVCSDDPQLRGEIEELLELDREAGSFLESPPPGLGATLDLPITEKPGTQIGPYKLLQQIGEGGMGVVYLAEQTEPVERRVALKVIKPGMDTQQVISRFEAERQALAMMDHPHIAKVLDAGTTETGRPYFVMELVNGVPVTQYCDEKQLTARERLELFVPICQAVQHAHQKGIIHRDIKPSNVLVAEYDDRAVPKIIDFGVAKAIEQRLTERTVLTEFGQVVGTIEYMSPEQAKLNQLDIDTRTDVYSLGVLLYELLTGETPFDPVQLRSAAFDEMLRIIREEEPPRPSLKLSTSESLPTIAANRHVEPKKLSTLVHGELDWIVMKALEKDRARRYETASKFAEDVEHYLNDEAVTACPPSTAYRFRKFARRNKAAIAMTAATAALLILGIVGTSWQAIRATHQRDRAVAAETKATAEAKRADAEAEKAKKQAERADATAEFAKAINEFLEDDLLGMAGATEQVQAQMSPDPDIKLRTLLDRAAAKIEERFPDQLVVQASLRYTIGNAYRAIGEYRKAETLLRQVVEAQRQEQPDILRNLADTYDDLGRYEEAEALYHRALSIARRTRDEEHLDTLAIMQNLASCYYRQERDGEAATLYEQTLEILRRTVGEEHPHTLACMNNLASVFEAQGHYEEAETLVRQALEIQSRTLGEDHPSTLHSMTTLAIIYRAERRYEEAEILIRRALEGCRRVLGEEHPDTISCMANLVATLQCQGRYKEAQTLCDEALEICRRTLGDDHPYTFGLVAVLSWLLATAPEPAERDPLRAMALAKQAIELQPNSADHWYVLGVALYRNGEFPEAVEALEKAGAMRGGHDPEYQFFLAMAYWQTGQRDKALENYTEAASWLTSGDRGEEHRRFAHEAKSLIMPNEITENAQEEATNQELSDE